MAYPSPNSVFDFPSTLNSHSISKDVGVRGCNIRQRYRCQWQVSHTSQAVRPVTLGKLRIRHTSRDHKKPACDFLSCVKRICLLVFMMVEPPKSNLDDISEAFSVEIFARLFKAYSPSVLQIRVHVCCSIEKELAQLAMIIPSTRGPSSRAYML